MMNTELALNMLVEVATTELSKDKDPQQLKNMHESPNKAKKQLKPPVDNWKAI